WLGPASLARLFVGTPLRPSDDRGDGPVGNGREHPTGVAEIDRAGAAGVTRDIRRGDRGDARSRTELQGRATRHTTRSAIVAVVVLHDLPALDQRHRQLSPR